MAAARKRSRPETEARIVKAARERFAERGFEATSVRDIAAVAEVDPALIYHYFGDKRGLLDAVLTLPEAAAPTLAAVLVDERDRPTAFLDGVLTLWDTDLEVRGHMVALVRTGLADEPSAAILHQLTSGMATAVFGDVMADDRRDLRTSLLTTQVAGLILRRYVLIDPILAAQPVDQVVAAVAPIIEHILTGPMPDRD